MTIENRYNDVLSQIATHHIDSFDGMVYNFKNAEHSMGVKINTLREVMIYALLAKTNMTTDEIVDIMYTITDEFNNSHITGGNDYTQ